MLTIFLRSTSVQYLPENKEIVSIAFKRESKEGPVCRENMLGSRFNLPLVTMHADVIHRGAGQIKPHTRRCCFAA